MSPALEIAVAGTGFAVALAALCRELWKGRGLRRALGRARKIHQETGLELESSRREASRAQLLQSVLDSMEAGVWITDEHGTVLEHNQALPLLLGTSVPLQGRQPLDIVRKSALHEAVARACGAGESLEVELSLDGARHLSVRVAPLDNGRGGARPGSCAVFRDVTELRHLEKVRQDFVANVSHELRTPITAILGYAETLRAGALDDKEHAPAMVEVIHRQSERLSQLVGDLLDLSKLDARQLRLSQTPVSLASAASRAADAVRQSAEGKQIRLSLEVPADLTALGDEQAVEQILVNLLDNAVKYTPAGGSIRVRGEQVPEGCSLTVHDSGMGIEPRHLPRLFERFYRVDRGRSREMGGTGLGLSIVKHLVSAMQGDVQVLSEPGVGTTFTVQLPGA